MVTPIYWGLFLTEQLPCIQPNCVPNQHVTFGFRTEPPKGIPWGELADVRLVAFGINDTNEGYEVELAEDQAKVYGGALVPHVTTGLDGGKAKDTWKVPFYRMEEPRTVKARWGRFEGGKVCYS